MFLLTNYKLQLFSSCELCHFCDVPGYTCSSRTVIMNGTRQLSYAAALADICSRDELEPEYELIKVEGPCHDPVFVMRGSVGEYSAEGRGQKKQTAKQEVAKSILLQMGELKLEDLKELEKTEMHESAKVIGNIVDESFNFFRSGTGFTPYVYYHVLLFPTLNFCSNISESMKIKKRKRMATLLFWKPIQLIHWESTYCVIRFC